MIFLPKLRHGGVEQRGDLFPGVGLGFRVMGKGLHVGLLFPAVAPALHGQGVGRNVAGGAAEPAG